MNEYWWALIGIIGLVLAVAVGVAISRSLTENLDDTYGAPCSYEACCNHDPNERAFSCDGTWCPNVVPNWTKPICDVGV